MQTLQICRVVAATFLLLLVFCGPAMARNLDQVPPYLKKEGSFVAYPAIVVGVLGAVVGGIIALPASLIAAPIGWAAGDPLGYAMLPVSVLGTAGAEAGYHVGGAVPWVLKKGFYDAPMTGMAKIRGEPASGLVAQVEPPPTAPGYPQYLDSTPAEARVPVTLPRHYSAALIPPPEPTSLMLRRQLSPFKPPTVRGAVSSASGHAVPAPPPVAVSQTAVPTATAPSTAASFAEPPAAAGVVTAPVAVTPMVVDAPVDAAPVVVPSDVASVESPPAATDEPAKPAVEEPATAKAEPAERPTLKKKKKSFSERFRF